MFRGWQNPPQRGAQPNPLELARARVAGLVPQGGAHAALAGDPQQAQQAAMAQVQQALALAEQSGAIPQGGAQAALAGCGWNGAGCMTSTTPAWAGLGAYPCAPITAPAIIPIRTFVGPGEVVEEEFCCVRDTWVCAVRALHFDPECLIIVSLTSGSFSWDILCGPIDAALWSTDNCWCPLDLGCVNCNTPGVFTFQVGSACPSGVMTNLYVAGPSVGTLRGCNSIFDLLAANPALALCPPGYAAAGYAPFVGGGMQQAA
jgi:hypothetical protein